MKKQTLSALLAAALVTLSLAGCGPKNTDDASQSAGSQPSGSQSVSSADGYALPNFMVLSGPTGVGAAKLISDDAYAAEHGGETEDGTSQATASSTVVAANDEVTAALISGETDIAAVATNVAANLYAKTDGGVQVLAVNTLGVLYILEKGDTVHSMADLAGKTLLAPSTGKGANPEYVLNYLLEQNGVQPSQVDIQWMTPQEITAEMTSNESGICMLPVPAATALLIQDAGVRQAVSLSDAWDELGQGALAQGCVVARTDYVQENPQGVESFLKHYEASIDYVKDEANLEAASQLVAQLEITPNAKIAAAAIPQCNLTYVDGEDMKTMLEGYYEVLFQADPASVGGSLPGDAFYYGAG